MITGYPHEGSGLFEVACGLIEQQLSRSVQSTVVSLGGFPAPRAAKYLKKNVFDFNPQYIVIQFGATDAQCPIRAGSRPTDHRSSLAASKHSRPDATLAMASYHSQPATALSPLRWQIASLIGHLRKLEPITPLSAYIAAIEQMADQCRSVGVKPVVLSPFIYGSGYTMRKAIPYLDALHELHARAGEIILIDCVSLLADFPKSKVLQHDGFHLSRLGHNLVGEAIGKAIVQDITRRSAGDARRNSQLKRA
jgi:lysophospholipase L1-like esterase